MKRVAIFLVLVVLTTGVVAQIDSPKIAGIIMIGKSGQPILDICIVDSTYKDEYKFDVHTIDLFAGKSTMQNIYSVFQSEIKYDSLTKYDYSFGTFLFSFRFQNGDKVKIVSNRKQSMLLFKNIIAALSPNNHVDLSIIEEIKNNLSRN